MTPFVRLVAAAALIAGWVSTDARAQEFPRGAAMVRLRDRLSKPAGAITAAENSAARERARRVLRAIAAGAPNRRRIATIAPCSINTASEADRERL